MIPVDVNDFAQEKECTFEGEHYSVRDNGAVLRHPSLKKRIRANDNKWTFGKENSANPYLHISSVRVHRIVATAFHGEPPDPKYVVDHIDTNRRNNRPKNLRWLTRLENALENPVTRKKIEYLCGSIEAFLENPSVLNDLQGDPNFTWMRTVTIEEAQNCKARMSVWANSERAPKRGTINPRKSSFGERIFKPLNKQEIFGREPGLDLSLTHWCAVYMMLRASAHFPCCPQAFGHDPLDDYFQNIKNGAVFAYCGDSDYNNICPKLTVIESVILKDTESILVKCERDDHKWSIVGITFDKKTEWFIHFNLGAYDYRDDVDKTFITKQELKDFWSDGYTNAYA